MEKFQGWIASLSNGETVFETEPLPNDFLPWRKLLHRLKEEDLQVTQLRLQKGGITVVCIPNAKGYVQAFEQIRSVNTGNEITYQGIGTIVNDLVFMNWVNDYGATWQDVRTLTSMRVHSTLQ